MGKWPNPDIYYCLFISNELGGELLRYRYVGIYLEIESSLNQNPIVKTVSGLPTSYGEKKRPQLEKVYKFLDEDCLFKKKNLFKALGSDSTLDYARIRIPDSSIEEIIERMLIELNIAFTILEGDAVSAPEKDLADYKDRLQREYEESQSFGRALLIGAPFMFGALALIVYLLALWGFPVLSKLVSLCIIPIVGGMLFSGMKS